MDVSTLHYYIDVNTWHYYTVQNKCTIFLMAADLCRILSWANQSLTSFISKSPILDNISIWLSVGYGYSACMLNQWRSIVKFFGFHWRVTVIWWDFSRLSNFLSIRCISICSRWLKYRFIRTCCYYKVSMTAVKFFISRSKTVSWYSFDKTSISEGK